MFPGHHLQRKATHRSRATPQGYPDEILRGHPSDSPSWGYAPCTPPCLLPAAAFKPQARPSGCGFTRGANPAFTTASAEISDGLPALQLSLTPEAGLVRVETGETASAINHVR